MPLYAYKCSSCHVIFEFRKAMSANHDQEPCAKCGKKATWLPSLFASKEGYNLRLPTGNPYREYSVDKNWE